MTLLSPCRGVRRCSLAAFLFGSAALTTAMMLPAPASARTAEVDHLYDIPAGPLADALNSLAEQSGAQLVYRSALTQGLTTSGLHGRFTRVEGFSRLLIGTDLAAQPTGANIFAIRRVTLSAVRIDPLHVRAAGEIDDPGADAGTGSLAADTADTVVVTASRYRGDVATSGARIDVPVRDLPLSISVVTDQLALDRQIRNIRELADNVAGVRSRQSGSGAFTIDFTIRGLEGTGSMIAVNGFRVENYAAGFDPQAIDRVEFLKGPASVLYGASSALSGLVNIVTKAPEPRNFLTLDAIGGAPGYGRGTVDGNLRLSDTLESRTNLAITRDSVPNAFREINERFAMQSFRWHPGNLSIIAEGSYFHSNGPSREATQLPELQRFFDLPRSFKIAERWDRDINTGFTGRFDASWRVTPNLTLRQGVNYQHYRQDSHDTTAYDGETYETLLAPDLVGRGLRLSIDRVNYVTSQTEARWNVVLGPTRHRLLAGFEYGHERAATNGLSFASISPLDLNNPVYGAPEPDIPITDVSNIISRSKAFYVQDFVEWNRLRLLLGLRRDDLTASNFFCSLLTPGCPTDPVVSSFAGFQKKAFSPRVGIAWEPSRRTTLFASWSRSFSPNLLLDRDNRILPPEYGTQYEAGLRQNLTEDGRLAISLSAYHLIRENIADCDVSSPDCFRYVAVGQQTIDGVDAEVSGRPVDWIDLIATYSHIRGRVTKSDVTTSGIPEGSRLPEAAPNSASLFAKVTLTPLGLPAVAVAAGAYFVDRRPTRNYFLGSQSIYSATVFALPSSTRFDLGAYWDVSERVHLQANITNLFDTRVYEPTNAGFNLTQPFRATLGVRFSL